MRHVGIVGGGISGLATAFRLCKTHTVSLFQHGRFGGWIERRRVAGFDFDLGPRTVRAGRDAAPMLELIAQLGIQHKLVPIQKDSDAARTRFIYAGGRMQEISPRALFAPPPVLRGALAAALREPFVRKRDSHVTDETIDAFVARRFSRNIADDVVSAVVRGIFAGDSAQISVRSAFPALWDHEETYGSVVLGMLLARHQERQFDPAAHALIEKMRSAAMFTLEGGLDAIVDALVAQLRESPNVTLHNERCTRLEFANDAAEITTETQTVRVDQVVTAVPGRALAQLVPSLARFLTDPYATVAVVNLGFREKLQVRGFGYLVPRTQDSAVIGTVFDSNVTGGGNGTRLTVMMPPGSMSKDEILDVAVSQASRHLGIALSPDAALVTIQKDCIPLYALGHSARIAALFDAKPALLWPRGLSGVGINSAVKYS